MSLDAETLKQRQALPLDAKIISTDYRIWEWYTKNHGMVYVSYSGGKDSTVLAHMVKSKFPDVPLVYCDTGLEYPEIRSMAIRNADVVLRPKKTFKRVIEEYGYPVVSKEQSRYIRDVRHGTERMRDLRLNGRDGRYKLSAKWRYLIDAPFEISEQCCDVMKKQPFKKYEKESGRLPIVATMACESSLRKNAYLKNGCNAFNANRPMSTPMAFWTDQDVLEYIERFGIEIPSVYGEIERERDRYRTTGLERTGCVFCMFGVEQENHPNRFERLRETHPNLYRYCMEDLRMDEVLDYIRVDH